MIRSLWSSVLLVPCYAYLAGTAAALSLILLGFRYQPVLALLGAFLPFVFIPVLLTLPMGLALRSRAAVAGSLALVVAFALMYGPAFSPKGGPSQAGESDSIKVMTFNIAPRRATPEQVIETIRRESPDIIGLQEVEHPSSRSLRAGLAAQYPYMILTPETSNIALLSRLPVLESRALPPARGTWAPLYATLDWRGKPLEVVVVHPPPVDIVWVGDTLIPAGLLAGDERSQAFEVAEFVQTLPGNVLVMGDFNQSEQSPGYAQISKILTDAYREAGYGFGFTFPAGLTARGIPVPGPLVRIDYILHSRDITASQAYARCDSGSDHCYVVAQLSPTGR